MTTVFQRADESGERFARARGCGSCARGTRRPCCVSGVREIWRENVLPAPRSRAFGADGGVNLARFRVWDVSVTRPVIVIWGVVSVSARGDRSAGNLINTHQGSEGHTDSRLPTVCSRGCGCLGFCGSNHTRRQHGVPAPHAVATELLRCLDETARGLAHVSAEQAVEVVYDECADHLWRCVEMWARWTVGMQGTCRGHAGRGERARACGRSRGV